MSHLRPLMFVKNFNVRRQLYTQQALFSTLKIVFLTTLMSHLRSLMFIKNFNVRRQKMWFSKKVSY